MRCVMYVQHLELVQNPHLFSGVIFPAGATVTLISASLYTCRSLL
jgi:hypothetical protein